MDNILHFPTSTLVNKPVPKNAFWQRAEGRTELKDFLTKEFDSITWLYKLAASTLNVAKGENVEEIDVFYCKMKSDNYSLNPFLAMDKLLPRHTLFIIEYGKSIDILMQYKEKVGDKWRFGETEMRRSLPLEGELEGAFTIVGNTLDSIYASLLSQVSGLNAHSEDAYKQQAELRKQIASIEKQIASLQSNIRKEKQFNKQIEMNAEVRALKKQQAELKQQIKQ